MISAEIGTASGLRPGCIRHRTATTRPRATLLPACENANEYVTLVRPTAATPTSISRSSPNLAADT